MQKNKWVHRFIIGTFVSLYLGVSVISTIHVVDFFKLSNPTWLAISLAIAFEIGAAASLASLIVLEKMNKTIVWLLFFALTFMQAMGNTYYAYVNLEGYTDWIELFGLMEEDPIAQKRILSIISGAILPLIALGFIKSLIDYIKPAKEAAIEKEKIKEEPVVIIEKVEEPVKEVVEEEIEEDPKEKHINQETQESADKIVDLIEKEEPKKPIRIKEKGRTPTSEYRKEEIAKRESIFPILSKEEVAKRKEKSQENKVDEKDKYNKGDIEEGLGPEFHNPQE